MPKPKNKAAPHRDSSSRYLYPVLIALLLLAMAGIWFFLQSTTPTVKIAAPAPVVKPVVVAPAKMVDEQQCQGCHQAQAKDWQGSHHQLAMQAATAQTVPADFDGVALKSEGDTTRLCRGGDEC